MSVALLIFSFWVLHPVLNVLCVCVDVHVMCYLYASGSDHMLLCRLLMASFT